MNVLIYLRLSLADGLYWDILLIDLYLLKYKVITKITVQWDKIIK